MASTQALALVSCPPDRCYQASLCIIGSEYSLYEKTLYVFRFGGMVDARH